MAAIAYLICCVLAIIIPWYTVAESDLSGIISDGDIMVGGIFPVHTGDEISKKSCLSLNKERGIQRLEAMRFSIMEINNDDSILKGLKLGTIILDSCSDATHALDESLNFVMSTLTASQTDKCSADSTSGGSSQNRPIVSVIGAAFSGVSLNIANLLRLFEIPQISYASTSAELSNKDKYGYFMRTVPPDKLQAQAFADIVRYFNWTYVSTVASAGEYGESGIESFKKQYKSSGQCIAAEVKIRSEPTAKDFEEAVINLYNDATGILSAATRLKYYDDFIWVASEGWGNAKKPVANNEQAAQGALTITLKSQVISEFDTYFNALSPTNNLDNIWFQQYWEKTHNCTLLPNTVTSGTPTNSQKLATIFAPEMK
ncbi:GRM3 [Bugula neritina]|uniref:GRM3 n=1 Tax=Bugula neritina TaxID=10212 RepID=A0A7J7K189_BUGNE|nr:GRM3 [Bugula neritina]